MTKSNDFHHYLSPIQKIFTQWIYYFFISFLKVNLIHLFSSIRFALPICKATTFTFLVNRKELTKFCAKSIQETTWYQTPKDMDRRNTKFREDSMKLLSSVFWMFCLDNCFIVDFSLFPFLETCTPLIFFIKFHNALLGD